MRKIEVKSLKGGCVDVVDGEWHHVLTERECGFVFGEIPDEGETKTYYVIPAGDVAEFEIECVNGFYDFADNSGDFPSEILEGNGIVFEDGETRRVTAIVHPPDGGAPCERCGGEGEIKEKLDQCGTFTRHDCPECSGGKAAKQPIILKRNNTPTRPGNYFYASHLDEQPMRAWVVRSVVDGSMQMESERTFGAVEGFKWWSDELGPIEFESEPEPPPKPKVGWFERDGRFHDVMKVGGLEYMIHPPIDGFSHFTDSMLEKRDITINWYGDDA